ncbi:MAG: efflux RND transporter permease subunit [Planctomycetota bacterium]|nr:MAG: efflux RND transporter permease subunit [Planctomycetota bacterium]
MLARHPLYDRPIAVMAILVAVMVLGGLLLPRLPVDIWPSFQSQAVFIRASVDRGTAEETLEQVTRPMEGLLRGVAGVETITSLTRPHWTRLVVSPTADADTRQVLSSINDTLAAQRHLFPDEMQLRVGTWSNEDTPPIAFAIGSGNHHPHAFHILLEEVIIPELASIEGVAAATYGDEDPARLDVILDRHRLQAADLSPHQVAQQLSTLQPTSLAMQLRNETGVREQMVHMRLNQGGADSLRNLRVDRRHQLDDVAQIVAQSAGADRVVLVNGIPGALVSVFRSPEANGYRVSAEAERRMQHLAAIHDFDLVIPTATHRTINAAGGELLSSGLWGGAFAALFVMLFLRRFRLTMLVCLAIPASFALAVIGLASIQAPINIFTMVGFLLALGMLVDNSVVVGESLSRAPGAADPRERVRLQRRAVQQVAMAIVLSTLTTIAIIAPFQFLDAGPLSRPINAIGVPIVWSLLGSLCVALILTPICYAWLHRRHSHTPQQRPRWLRALECSYARILHFLLRQPAIAVLVLALLVLIPIALVRQHPAGLNMDASLDTDERRAVLPIVQRGWVPQERLSEVAQEWYAQLQPHLQDLGATGVVAEIGGRRSEMHIYLQPVDDGLDSDMVADMVADIIQPHLDVALQAHLDRARGEAASSGRQQRWRRRTASADGERLHLSLVLSHPHADALPESWQRLRAFLEEQPGTHWMSGPIEDPEPHYELALTREAMASGFRPQPTHWQINRLIGHRHITDLPDGTPLSMGPRRWAAPTMAELEAIHIRAQDHSDGAPTSIKTVAAITQPSTIVGDDRIRRRDGMSEHQVRVVVDADRRNDILALVRDPGIGARIGAPDGLQVSLTWWQQRGDDSRRTMLVAIALAITTVLLIMALFYESIIAPFAALASVPLALLSVIAWAGYSGGEMGVMALIGCFFLVGIVVNNGIVLVDRLRRTVAPTRCDHSPRVAAALTAAARRRLAPILLTSATTIAAAVPMALGSARLAGLPIAELGATIAVGLAGATVCTLFVVPLTYYWLARLRRGLQPGELS